MPYQIDRESSVYEMGLIDTILLLYCVLCLDPHIAPILTIFLSLSLSSCFSCCLFHPKESAASSFSESQSPCLSPLFQLVFCSFCPSVLFLVESRSHSPVERFGSYDFWSHLSVINHFKGRFLFYLYFRLIFSGGHRLSLVRLFRVRDI